MAVSRKVSRTQRTLPSPPLLQAGPIIHGNQELMAHWLLFYWRKLEIPKEELVLLAMTDERREFARWTGKRLDSMALGCYCFIPSPSEMARSRRKPYALQTAFSLPASPHRHLIFIEPAMQQKAIEVTIAHELIHLSDRVQGNPRRHTHHGHDAIATDEAAVTGYPLADLRALLHEESLHREQVRRASRPIRYLYVCPQCGKQYPRTRRYSHAVSCSHCDKNYNPRYHLYLLPLAEDADYPTDSASS
jgi:hypothetical protein